MWHFCKDFMLVPFQYLFMLSPDSLINAGASDRVTPGHVPGWFSSKAMALGFQHVWLLSFTFLQPVSQKQQHCSGSLVTLLHPHFLKDHACELVLTHIYSRESSQQPSGILASFSKEWLGGMCYGLNCVPTKIHILKFNPQYLRM